MSSFGVKSSVYFLFLLLFIYLFLNVWLRSSDSPLLSCHPSLRRPRSWSLSMDATASFTCRETSKTMWKCHAGGCGLLKVCVPLPVCSTFCGSSAASVRSFLWQPLKKNFVSKPLFQLLQNRWIIYWKSEANQSTSVLVFDSIIVIWAALWLFHLFINRFFAMGLAVEKTCAFNVSWK